MRNKHLFLAATALFSVSSALLATSFTLAPAAVLVLAVVSGCLLVAFGPVGALLERPVEKGWLGQCVLFAFLCAIVGGQGHLVYSKADWLYRDAVLADVALNWLPVVYGEGAQQWLLRAPLGMYLVPGGVGRLFGLNAAHLALVAQNSLLLGVTLYLPTLVWPRRRLLFLVLFMVFSGLDVLPFLLKTGGAWLPVNLSYWSEEWLYASHASQFIWSPNHALAGWFFAAAAVLYLNGEIDLAALAAASTPLVFWSPLMLVGAAGLFLFFLFRAPGAALSWRFVGACLSAAAYLPELAYLATDAGKVPHEWLALKQGFLESYLEFVLFALAPAFFLVFLRDRVEPWFRSAVYVSIALLLVIPVYRAGDLNDFSLRVSIVPLAMLAFAFSAVTVDLLVCGPPMAFASALVLALLGAVGPALELYDALSTRAFSVSDCNLLTVDKKLHPKMFLAAYFADMSSVPPWMKNGAAVPLVRTDRLCWPDRVYGEKLFDWLSPENRIWLRKPPGE